MKKKNYYQMLPMKSHLNFLKS